MAKNREFGFLVDERANPAQRAALRNIFTGEAGGAFAAWRDLTIRVDGVEFVPMEFSHDAENWRVQVPGMVDGLGGPFRKYMVPENDTCQISQCPATGGRARISDRRPRQAQCRQGGFWPGLGLGAALIEAYRVRPARTKDLLLAQIASQPVSRPGGNMPVRDRVAVLVLLGAVTVLAWAYTIQQAHLMQEMDAAMWRDMDMSMNAMKPSWTLVTAVLLFLTWAVMMAAMMLPGTSPMIQAFATINRRRRERTEPYVPTVLFVAGHLVVWSVFAALATALQWLLQTTGLVTTMMQSASSYFSAALFLAAGLYQFSPLKQRCLTFCRSPNSFILSEWREGALGAAIMGVRHGLFCLGCCAALMLLLFAVAVMDLRWVAALTLLITAEKLLPGGKSWRPAIGVGLLVISLGFAVAAWRA